MQLLISYKMADKLYILFDQSGKVTGSNYFEEGQQPELSTDILPKIHSDNLYFNSESAEYYDGTTEEELGNRLALHVLYPEVANMPYKLIQLDNLEGIKRDSTLADKGLKGEKKYKKENQLIWSSEKKYWFQPDGYPEGFRRITKLYKMNGDVADQWEIFYELSDGDKGDITVSGSGTVWTIDNGFDATKIADGSVSNTEFQRLDGVTGNIQTQIDGKQAKVIWMSNTSPYTLTSQTSLQKAFNIGANGGLNAGVKTYKFEGLISLSSLSSSPGNISFGFLGTATVASIRYTHMSMKGVLVSTPFSSLVTTVNQTIFSNANSNTAGYMQITGIVRISGAGTFIPAVGMSVAAAAVVDTNSYFKFIELGADTDTQSTIGIS